MHGTINLQYASSLTKICEKNSSFDAGVLKVCYVGDNRNKTSFTEEDIIKCLPSIYNCPIACHYMRDTDSLGGHDMEVIKDANGRVKPVNLTQPIGVIPESAETWFEDCEEADGTTHRYLFVDALLWKRQEAYEKVKRDGITAHSMEVNVKDSVLRDDGVYQIKNFEFTAFVLIGVEPCFEGSALETFSQKDYKAQFELMMQDYKACNSMFGTPKGDDDKHPNDTNKEGGEKTVQEKMELLASYGFAAEELEFNMEEFSVEELKEKFEAMKAAAEAAEPTAEPVVEDVETNGAEPEGEAEKFAQTSNLQEELCRALRSVTMTDEYGEWARYCYADSDFELGVVYAWDNMDWLLYGFNFTMNGDSVVIDFGSCKRKKYAIVDFDEGEQPSPFYETFSAMKQSINENASYKQQYENAVAEKESMNEELNALREFKRNAEETEAAASRDALFAQFTELEGNEVFEALRNDAAKFDLETLEEKCYAIRGKLGVTKYSVEKTPKQKVVNNDTTAKEPYGGLFVEYGIAK